MENDLEFVNCRALKWVWEYELHMVVVGLKTICVISKNDWLRTSLPISFVGWVILAPDSVSVSSVNSVFLTPNSICRIQFQRF